MHEKAESILYICSRIRFLQPYLQPHPISAAVFAAVSDFCSRICSRIRFMQSHLIIIASTSALFSACIYQYTNCSTRHDLLHALSARLMLQLSPALHLGSLFSLRLRFNWTQGFSLRLTTPNAIYCSYSVCCCASSCVCESFPNRAVYRW